MYLRFIEYAIPTERGYTWPIYNCIPFTSEYTVLGKLAQWKAEVILEALVH